MNFNRRFFMEKQELTAADVWAMLADLTKKQEETDRQLKEADRRREEERKEAERQRKEAEKRREEERIEADRQRKEADKRREEAEKRREEERIEADRRREEERKEAEKRREEERKEADRRREEAEKRREEADRRFEERLGAFNRHLGYFGQSLGDVVELILVPGIREKMNTFGHHFTRMGPNKIYNRHNKKTLTEIDLLLENCEEAMAVEIKTDLSVKWVNRHLDRLELLRKNEDITGLKGRTLYAAVAGITVDEDARELALEKGMYVIDMKEDEERLEVMEPTKEVGRW
jgi:flagellar biosynthesis GTPase FlhF